MVTGDQARALKPGDYLCWSESGELGVVVRVSRFSVTVRWSSGRLTEPLVNDMNKFHLTDIDGRRI